MSSTQSRKATNITLGEGLLNEARSLNINISQAAEAGLARAVAEKRAALWVEANRTALESSNRFVETQGLPLARYRKF
ncbi:MAG TPA: type II toxin-antitoxin system CcdA family antitoxin [Burkholderiales bacterium]|nr:type II toxin-antitoxin system CcdA family antitoxin [Burkholderiales bacterium]